jgi:2-polyprenyl-6-methoxyphenol hydroxylase-like FAD-dependent oxidoreductase
LERNPAPLLHDQGAGIVAGGHALAFLQRYNRCQRKAVAVRSTRRQYLDKEGNIVHSVDAAHDMSSWGLTYHLMRANYDGLASAYCDVPPPDPSHGTASHLHDRTVTAVDLLDIDNDGGVCVAWQSTSDPSQTGTLNADVVIGADGPGSSIRSLFSPHTQRTYAGYCALRGTVVEHEATPGTLQTFANRFTFYHGPGIQILAYLIPGEHGTVEPGQRLINFVYYTNFPADSPELAEILTDCQGKRHRITVPPGMMDPKAWQRQTDLARARLPPQFAEIVCKTQRPFVQAVTDVLSPANEFCDGRVVLIGDALAGFRPHTVASTAQAAFDAMLYADYVAGRLGREEWTRFTMGYARGVQRRSVEMGERSQFRGLGLEEYIRDRDEASVEITMEVLTEWAGDI